MATYSEMDLKYAAQFRDEVHREALARVRRVQPDADRVVDRYAVEDYFQQHWDYPGRWYTIVAIPAQCRSREALIDTIVRDTLDRYTPRADTPAKRDAASAKTPLPCPADAPSPEPECPGDPFYALLAAYPDCAVDYCIVTDPGSNGSGCAAHRRALERACRKILAEEGWEYDLRRAQGRRIDAAELFSSHYAQGRLNYRRAFLYPPHGNDYTGADFVRVNAALFPEGTQALEVFEWSTDWSEYFDEGREWWGTLCLTVYDPHLARFAVLLASATD